MNPPLASSDPALNMIADLIQQKTGLEYDHSRIDLLADRLAGLLAQSGLGSFLDYYYFLRYDPQAESEWLRVQSALAVNETYFWREYDQIQAIVRQIVPRFQRERPAMPVRIWVAACATGEEPYSLAISLNEAGCYSAGEVMIHATDFNNHALEQAREGVFRRRSFRSIPPEIMLQYFIPMNGDRFKLVDEIRERVTFSYLNLLDETGMGQMGNYDIIICRNAFIYFSSPAIKQVAEWFYRSLKTGGYLFVAAAESLLRLTNLFELVEVGNAFAYQKRPAESSATKGLYK